MPIIAFIIGAILLGTGPIGWVILLFGLFCYGGSWLAKDIDRSSNEVQQVSQEPEYQVNDRPVSYQSYLYMTPYDKLSKKDQKAKRDLEARDSLNMML